MKKKILTEIKKIKSLINILEQDEKECEDFLEKKDYIVYSPLEQNKRNTNCEKKENIKCVIDFFKQKNKPVNILTTGSSCYVELKSKDSWTYDNAITYNKFYWFFWESGDFSLVKSLDPNDISKWEQLENKNIFQLMRNGDFKCVNNDIQLLNVKWSGYYKDFDTNKKENKDIQLSEKNGSLMRKISTLIFDPNNKKLSDLF